MMEKQKEYARFFVLLFWTIIIIAVLMALTSDMKNPLPGFFDRLGYFVCFRYNTVYYIGLCVIAVVVILVGHLWNKRD